MAKMTSQHLSKLNENRGSEEVKKERLEETMPQTVNTVTRAFKFNDAVQKWTEFVKQVTITTINYVSEKKTDD